MNRKNISLKEWKNDHIECFTSCLDLFSRDSFEYRQLKKCIDELKKL